MKLKAICAGLFILSIAAITSCEQKGDTPAPARYNVVMMNDRFAPDTITVPVGATVIWTNKENDIHTVTSDNRIFTSGDLGLNSTFSYTFNTIGTFNYHCIHHQAEGMIGTVYVKKDVDIDHSH